MIEINRLTLQRGNKVLLEQASARITPGRRVGLIGKNGSGKSSPRIGNSPPWHKKPPL